MIDNNYCAFSRDHKCIQWMDYELTRYELAEANEYVMETGLKSNICGNISMY